MASLRLVLVVVVASLAAAVATYPGWGNKRNKLIGTFTLVPGGLFNTGYFEMPRTQAEAAEDDYTQALDRLDVDGTTVWCRSEDYRLCILYDRKGSVAGLQTSNAVSEIEASNLPQQLDDLEEWFRQTVFGTEVFSSIYYFIDQATLDAGGRDMSDDVETAPEGMRLLKTSSSGDLSAVDVPLEESRAAEANLTEQACFLAMGKHYAIGLAPELDCDEQRPYFGLYSSATKLLHGFGVLMFGTITSGDRKWFEQPPIPAIKAIVPNRNECFIDWAETYTLNSIHVYFVANPWLIGCPISDLWDAITG